MPTATAPARRRTRELEPLAGLSAIDAIIRLRDLELRPAVEPCESAPRDHGLVLAQEPGPGAEVCRGQLITLLIGEHADNPAAVTAPARRKQPRAARQRPPVAPGDTQPERTTAPPPAVELVLPPPGDPAPDSSSSARLAPAPPIEPLLLPSLCGPADDEARVEHGDRAAGPQGHSVAGRLRSARIVIAVAPLLSVAFVLAVPSLVSPQQVRPAIRSTPRAASPRRGLQPRLRRRIADVRRRERHEAALTRDLSRAAPPAPRVASDRAQTGLSAPPSARSHAPGPTVAPGPASPIGPVPGPAPSQ